LNTTIIGEKNILLNNIIKSKEKAINDIIYIILDNCIFITKKGIEINIDINKEIIKEANIAKTVIKYVNKNGK
jgi:hypothetical protein